MNRDEILTLLSTELSSTMGCTDVGAIGFAAARGASLLEGELRSAQLTLSDMLYKNALRVGIPGTFTSGVGRAVLLGYLLRNPDKRLRVFEDAGENELEQVDALQDQITIDVSHVETSDPLHIDLTLVSDHTRVNVLLQGGYDSVARVEVNGRPVFEAAPGDSPPASAEERALDTSIDELYEFVMKENEALAWLQNLAAINYDTAQLGLADRDRLSPTLAHDLEQAATLVRKYILSASGQRMAGAAVPVTGVAGSGNLGITTLTSTRLLAEALDAGEEQTRRALALTVLIGTYIKRKMGLLTTICGSSLAGGAAVAAATVFLCGGSLDQVKHAINMLIAINAGTLCDGAKPSCAFKVGFSAENGVTAAKMALEGQALEDDNGINKADVEESIRNITDINNRGLETAGRMILEII